MKNPVGQVDATVPAVTLIRSLKKQYGNLMFHQSGGCCDGSAPMCYPVGDFLIGEHDVLFGYIVECPVYIGGSHYDIWKDTTLTIDVANGRASGFSIEAPEGQRFVARSGIRASETGNGDQEC